MISRWRRVLIVAVGPLGLAGCVSTPETEAPVDPAVQRAAFQASSEDPEASTLPSPLPPDSPTEAGEPPRDSGTPVDISAPPSSAPTPESAAPPSVSVPGDEPLPSVLARPDPDPPDLDFPDLHADPFESSGIPPSERDPYLFPGLVNAIVENNWDLYSDPARARYERDRRRATYDVRNPGPDSANFPNAAYTLPKGRAYIELMPVNLIGPSDVSEAQYNTAFLLRYGVTDNLEFRLFSNGFTAQLGRRNRTTGFSPLAFDFKMNFWEENPKYFIPAFGLEVYVETDLGTPAFNGGTQPSLNLLFDHTLPGEIVFEYNFSITGQQFVQGLSDHVFGFQWSFQRDVVEDFALFTHGFFNAPALPRLPSLVPLDPSTAASTQESIVAGGGFLWALNDRLALYGTYNAGLNRFSPTTISYLGFAYAF